MGMLETYDIKIYTSLNGTECTNYTQDQSVLNIEYDGDKLIEDDFFAFEAKRCKIDFVLTGTPLTTALKGIFDSNNLLTRTFPQYPDQTIYIADEVTPYIDCRIEIFFNNKLVFVGVPDSNTFSRDFKTNRCTMEIISIYGLFFDNINNLEDLRAFNSYLLDEGYGRDTLTYNPITFLKEFIRYYKANGITITDSILQLTDEGSNNNVIEITNPTPIYFNNEEIGRGFFEDSDPDFSNVYYSVAWSTNSNKELIVSFYEQIKKTNCPIIFRRSDSGILYVEGILNMYEYTSHVDLIIGRQTKIVIDYITKKIKSVKITQKNINNLYSVLNKNDDIDSFEIREQYNHKTGINVYMKARTYSTDTLNGICALIPDKIESSAIEYSIGQQTLFPSVGAFSGIIIYTRKKRIDVFGNIYPTINIDADQNNAGEWYIDFIKNSNSDAVTDGLFNPEKFNSKEFFKNLLILSGRYLTFNNNSMKLIPKDNLFNLDIDSTVIDVNNVVSLNKTQTLIDIVEQFTTADYSESDNHWFIRLLAYEYKYLLPRINSTFKLQLFNETNTPLEIGQKISILLNGEWFNFIINSIEIQDLLLSIECLKIT